MHARHQHTLDVVVRRLTAGPGTVAQVARETGLAHQVAQKALSELFRAGTVECGRGDRSGIGVYRLAATEEDT